MDKSHTPLAYKNEQFLDSDEARPLRILVEYLEPLHAFRHEHVRDTIVFFGSARFPGGFGTLDELYEILTLMQTRKIDRRIPIVLYGSNEIINFDALVRHGMINREDLALFEFADDPEVALGLLQSGIAAELEETTPLCSAVIHVVHDFVSFTTPTTASTGPTRANIRDATRPLPLARTRAHPPPIHVGT